MRDIADALKNQGFALVPGIADSADIATLKSLFETADIARAERSGETYGARNLLALPEVRHAAKSTALDAVLRPLLEEGYQAVRGIFFDKTESANWPVLWHQDLSLAVKERHEIQDWSNWSVKREVQHVQPPTDILARMITVRLHLDDCPADNGALRVIPGSHRLGRLSREQIRAMVAKAVPSIIVARAGEALLMHPLILHASSQAMTPRHRRVLHLEFAPAGLLPAGLNWAEAA